LEFVHESSVFVPEMSASVPRLIPESLKHVKIQSSSF